jgi:hypothetical protein
MKKHKSKGVVWLLLKWLELTPFVHILIHFEKKLVVEVGLDQIWSLWFCDFKTWLHLDLNWPKFENLSMLLPTLE